MTDDALITIEVDGRQLQAKPGAMLIEVTDAAGIAIPRFCYHKKLTISANCRMCLVEIDRAPKPLPACATPVIPGMKVKTRSSMALAAQRGSMEFLLINHPLDCPICDQGGECELQDVAMGYGQDFSQYTERKRVVQDKDFGPLIATDMTRCIHCTRCVRFGDEIAGMREIGATGRGEHTRIGTFIQRSVDSELSGNIIDLCPVGALTSKPFRFSARAWELQHRPTIASHDSVGSNISAHVRRNHILRVHPVENGSTNEVWISDRDRFSYEGLYSEDRLLHPMLKSDGVWREVDWSVALDVVAQELSKLVNNGKKSEVATLISHRASLEELYLARKFTTAVGGSFIEHRLRQEDFRGDSTEADVPWLGMSIEDIEKLQSLFIIGSNLRKEQPLLNHRVRKAALGGAEIYYLNPMRYEQNYKAEQIVASPHQMLEHLGALASIIGVSIKGVAADIINNARPTYQHHELVSSLRQAHHKAILLGSLAQAHPDYAVLRDLASAIAIETGAIFGFVPIGPNTVGAYIVDATMRKTALDGMPGDVLSEQKKCYLLFGIEPHLDMANPAKAMQRLGASEFVVAISSFRSAKLDQVATILLPLAEYFETEGTYVNAGGLWQSFSAAVHPRGRAKPGWSILRSLGNRIGLQGFDYSTTNDVLDEFRSSYSIVLPNNNCKRAYIDSLQTKTDVLVRIGDVPIYATDALVRRAAVLQQTKDACWPCSICMSKATAERYGVGHGEEVWINQGGDKLKLIVNIDSNVPDLCARVPSGLAGTECLGGQFTEMKIERA